jgi:hypothetical protein
VPAALTRIAQLADGWNPAGIPVDGMQQMFGGVKDMARAAGRDASTLELIVRANVEITAKPRPPDGRSSPAPWRKSQGMWKAADASPHMQFTSTQPSSRARSNSITGSV